ncbi:MAG: hypothetical protein D4R81_03080 [Nitrospiraceae bacterium]|nr:MAG: hypothetical protein D4R81_03080 [Nitrospiraceae bacterium]
MKTNKHQTLLLVKVKQSVQALDVVQAFKYSAGTARSYLAHLGRQDLLQRTLAGHILTTKGENRLQFFEVAGCADLECPRCQGKAGSFTCPTCGWKLQKDHARVKASWETIFFKRDAGVFCQVCQAQMFNEVQARLAGIQEEEKNQ